MISNIQVLRAFAAINVVLFHIIGTSISYSQDVSIFRYFEGWGANGVDIFFVISGFVMLHTQLIRRRSPYEFFKNRAIRIVPIYWLLTIFVLTLFIALPSIFREMVVTPVWVFSSLFFTSSIFTGEHPVVYVGWTLEWEMLFYLTFTVSLFFKSWRLQVAFVVVFLAFFSVFSGNWIVLEFLFGMLIAYIFKIQTFSNKQGLIIFTFGAFLLLASIPSDTTNLGSIRVLVWGIPSFFIVFGFLYSVQIKNQTSAYLGDASYSIYLVQILTIPAFYKLSSTMLSSWNSDFLAFLCLVTSVTFGCIFYSAIEKPVTVKLKRLLNS